MINSFSQMVRDVIDNAPKGWVFTHKDFNKIDNIATVERVLSRLVQTNKIKRIRRGLYYIPEQSRWGEVPPTVSNILQALQRDMNTTFIPDGANALYQLGVTRQIPMKQVYLTNKQIKPIILGKNKIEFKKVSDKKLSGANNSAGTYLSAIEYLGKDEIVNDDTKKEVASSIMTKHIAELMEASKNRSAWVRNAVDEILKEVA